MPSTFTVDSSELTESEYAQFAQFLERQCGIVLGQNKLYLVRSRLMPLVRETNAPSLSALIKNVMANQQANLRAKVIDAMTTNETLWFRDRYPFDLLTNQLFDELSSKKHKIRVWSAACSSGQEPYSFAMLFKEYKKRNPSAFPYGVEVIATDISDDMLGRGKEAKYDMLSINRGLPEDLKRHYFNQTDDGYMQLKSEIRSMVQFRPLNLLNSYRELGTFDLVFCRNVLIYFSAENKRRILQQIAASLQSRGILFLGASESIAEAAQEFAMVRCSPGLYYRKKS